MGQTNKRTEIYFNESKIMFIMLKKQKNLKRRKDMKKFRKKNNKKKVVDCTLFEKGYKTKKSKKITILLYRFGLT